MGKRGPKTTPTNLKVLRGNPGRRPLPEDEPEPEIEDNEQLEWLKPGFDGETITPAFVWEKIKDHLYNCGLLTAIDKISLNRYCDMLVQWLELRDLIMFHGYTYVVTRQNKDGSEWEMVKQRPEVRIYTDLGAKLLQLEREFGLTPSARTGLSVNMKKNEEDPDDAFFKRNRA